MEPRPETQPTKTPSDSRTDGEHRSVDSIKATILSMKSQVQTAERDQGGPMNRLESVQDQLIQQLDDLNDRIETYIQQLADQRKSA